MDVTGTKQNQPLESVVISEFGLLIIRLLAADADSCSYTSAVVHMHLVAVMISINVALLPCLRSKLRICKGARLLK